MSKYKNPISSPRLVTIPVWEYAKLVAKANTLETLHTLVLADKKYLAADVLDALYIDREEEFEE